MNKLEKIYNFLNDAQTYYLATVDKDQPRVRPFGTILLFENKLYIQTGKNKDVSKQILNNNKVELCAFLNGDWLRLQGTLEEDQRREVKKVMLDKYPSLRAMYNEDDNNTEIFYFKSGIAIFSSFTKPKEEFEI
jgi:uncharacterized pyridoxamine 5'-phosphate oxidase family protein